MIGIVVLNYKNWKETIECITSIVTTTNVDYEVFIVDNDSPNDSYERLLNHYSEMNNIHVYKAEDNNGYAAGNNIGICKALDFEVDYVLIANPDIIFKKNAINTLIEGFKIDNRVAVVGPKVLTEDGEIQRYTRGILCFNNYLSMKKPFNYFMRKTRTEYLKTKYQYDYNLIFEGMVSGCCFVMDANIFKLFNGFDENTFLFGEEDILGIKLNRMGKKACLMPESVVIHKGSTSFEKRTNNAFIDLNRYSSAFYTLCEYVRITGTQKLVVSFINIGSFIIKSINHPEYRSSLKTIIKRYWDISKNH